jgi:hypothetical protein
MVTLKNGVIQIWDRYWTKQIGTVIPNNAVIGAEHPPGMAESQEVVSPEPAMSGQMQARLKEFKESYGDENVTSEWTGRQWVITIPGEQQFFSSGGSYSGSQIL